MKIETTSLSDLLILTPKVFGDPRGFFRKLEQRNTEGRRTQST